LIRDGAEKGNFFIKSLKIKIKIIERQIEADRLKKENEEKTGKLYKKTRKTLGHAGITAIALSNLDK